MKAATGAALLLRALWEMARYDTLVKMAGFAAVRRGMRPAGKRHDGVENVDAVCEAVGMVSSFYWKPLQCLQRSVVTARLLRAEGIHADVVIGFRANPFFSHAWVEVGGRVVNDSAAYQSNLQPLDRF